MTGRNDDVAARVLQGARDLTRCDVVECHRERTGGDALALGGAGDRAAVQRGAEQLRGVTLRHGAGHGERVAVAHRDEVDQTDLLEVRRRGDLFRRLRDHDAARLDPALDHVLEREVRPRPRVHPTVRDRDGEPVALHPLGDRDGHVELGAHHACRRLRALHLELEVNLQ